MKTLRSAQVLLMGPLFCFSRARRGPGLLRLSLLGSHVTLCGGLVLLGLALCFIDSFPVTAPAASLIRPFMSSATPSAPALGPDSFAIIVSRRFRLQWCSRLAARTAPLPGELGHKRSEGLGAVPSSIEDEGVAGWLHCHLGRSDPNYQAAVPPPASGPGRRPAWSDACQAGDGGAIFHGAARGGSLPARGDRYVQCGPCDGRADHGRRAPSGGSHRHERDDVLRWWAPAAVRAYKRATDSGGALRLVVTTAQVRRIFRLLGIDRVLDVYPQSERGAS